ncbi:MAG TPA: hypothetical protein VIA07_00275 [Desulfuromonadales bacterium]|jgi:hypothetical protein
MRRQLLQSAVLSLSLLLVAACTSYKSQEVSFRPPSAMPNMQIVAGAQVAAQAYVDKAEAKQAFGFDIRDAGLLPVQVIVDNGGNHGLLVVPEQTFLIDAQGNMWNLLDRRTAYERMEKSSEYARVAKSAGRGSVFGATGGALLGAAIGILTGDNVGEAAIKGAALGGAGGAVIGGGQELGSDESARQISSDLANKELENKVILPGSLGRGFLFFPGEAPSAAALRLQLAEEESGQTHTRTLPLQ